VWWCDSWHGPLAYQENWVSEFPLYTYRGFNQTKTLSRTTWSLELGCYGERRMVSDQVVECRGVGLSGGDGESITNGLQRFQEGAVGVVIGGRWGWREQSCKGGEDLGVEEEDGHVAPHRRGRAVAWSFLKTDQLVPSTSDEFENVWPFNIYKWEETTSILE
jgi:hypothetical protein